MKNKIKTIGLFVLMFVFVVSMFYMENLSKFISSSMIKIVNKRALLSVTKNISFYATYTDKESISFSWDKTRLPPEKFSYYRVWWKLEEPVVKSKKEFPNNKIKNEIIIKDIKKTETIVNFKGEDSYEFVPQKKYFFQLEAYNNKKQALEKSNFISIVVMKDGDDDIMYDSDKNFFKAKLVKKDDFLDTEIFLDKKRILNKIMEEKKDKIKGKALYFDFLCFFTEDALPINKNIPCVVVARDKNGSQADFSNEVSVWSQGEPVFLNAENKYVKKISLKLFKGEKEFFIRKNDTIGQYMLLQARGVKDKSLKGRKQIVFKAWEGKKNSVYQKVYFSNLKLIKSKGLKIIKKISFDLNLLSYVSLGRSYYNSSYTISLYEKNVLIDKLQLDTPYIDLPNEDLDNMGVFFAKANKNCSSITLYFKNLAYKGKDLPLDFAYFLIFASTSTIASSPPDIFDKGEQAIVISNKNAEEYNFSLPDMAEKEYFFSLYAADLYQNYSAPKKTYINLDKTCRGKIPFFQGDVSLEEKPLYGYSFKKINAYRDYIFLGLGGITLLALIIKELKRKIIKNNINKNEKI